MVVMVVDVRVRTACKRAAARVVRTTPHARVPYGHCVVTQVAWALPATSRYPSHGATSPSPYPAPRPRRGVHDERDRATMAIKDKDEVSVRVSTGGRTALGNRTTDRMTIGFV